MSEFPALQYSMKDVVRAGKALRDDVLWEPDRRAEIERIFSVANSWRASHALPMHRLRAELHGRMSALELKGLTAARLKQMSSIRAKLSRLEGNLRQLQDLGGCRAVLPGIEHTRLLVGEFASKSTHTLKRNDPYIDEPRSSGYRSHHLVFGFQPRDRSEDKYAGRLIEVQIRTRLQHSWATAVEAVGLYRNENLKAGMGTPEWLRLFELMSIEFAATEGCEFALDGSNSRKEEIAELNGSLDAIQTLDTLSLAVESLGQIEYDRRSRPKYCHIKYDHQKRQVRVEYLSGPSEIEKAFSNTDRSAHSSVVVELDKIENLKSAYPNYFGDVQLFKSSLSEVIHGRPVKEYSLPPVERVPPPPKEIPDDSWLRFPHRRNRRWQG
ncbi:RelA/SpoT domain-containing protein [Citromicrobium bathyomarinum]